MQGKCRRCRDPEIQRLYSISFRKKQYWVCGACTKEIDIIVKGKPLKIIKANSVTAKEALKLANACGHAVTYWKDREKSSIDKRSKKTFQDIAETYEKLETKYTRMRKKANEAHGGV